MTNQPQAPAALTPKERAERADARLKIVTAVLALLTSVLALLTGVFVRKSDTASAKVDTTQQQIDALASENAALKVDNDKKATTIQQLEAARPEPTSSSTDSSLPKSETPAVLHAGSLTLKPNMFADLDAPADQTQWGINGGSSDFYFSSNAEEVGPSTNALALVTRQTASYATCHDTTGYSNEDISVIQLQRSKTVCVITADGRYSVLKIKSASNSQVSFDVTSYAKDGE